MDLSNLFSVINGYNNTLDNDRAFTFIEFIKLYGGENTQESFLTDYKDYLVKWAQTKRDEIDVSEKEYVTERLFEILKSITLTYSSYEEQQFIKSIDWSNKNQIKQVLPLYVRKIREICEFYRKKRNEAHLIVQKYARKGSYQSIEQIIYEKIVDFIFNNRELQPQMAELKDNLMVSIEQYVDTYSEYFDIPRENLMASTEGYTYDEWFSANGGTTTEETDEETTPQSTISTISNPISIGNIQTIAGETEVVANTTSTITEEEIIDNGAGDGSGNEENFNQQANQRDPDWQDYLQTDKIINGMLYSGEVLLDELGLTADLALDFTQECTGEMLALKNTLVSNSTINQIPLNEQVDLKRKLYEKFLGCDLYYMFVDENKNITVDVLCEAKNPTGNLLNCDSADRAANERTVIPPNLYDGNRGVTGSTSNSTSGNPQLNTSKGSGEGGGSTNNAGGGGDNKGTGGNSGTGGGGGIGDTLEGAGSSGGASGEIEEGSDKTGGKGWKNLYDRGIDVSGWGTKGSNYTNTGMPINESLELLSRIGLFFKPDKTSILKIDARDFSWSINPDAVIEDSVYVFPDPTKYGNFGNNKNEYYPLIMEFKLNHDIRNISSGYAGDDPLILLDRHSWQSYYSKQQDIFKIIDNKNFDYNFTSLANMGMLQQYQIDPYGNEFGVLKGINIVWKDEGTEPGGPGEGGGGGSGEHGGVDHVEVPEGWFPEQEEPKQEEGKEDRNRAYIINGGYFEDPYAQGQEITNDKGEVVYIPGKKFNYDKRLTINEYYHWTSMKLGLAPLVTPDALYPALNFGDFEYTRRIMSIFKYYDHFRYIEGYVEVPSDKDDVVEDQNDNFGTKPENGGDEEEGEEGGGSGNPFGDVPLVKKHTTYLEMQESPGDFYIKSGASLEEKPKLFSEVFTWLPEELRKKRVINIIVKKDCLIFETKDEIVFAPYKLDEDSKIADNLDLSKLIVLKKEQGVHYSDILWNEKEQRFFLAVFNEYQAANDKLTLVPMIYKFNPVDYSFTKVVSGWEFNESFKKELDKIDLQYFFAVDRFNAYQAKIKELSTNKKEGDTTFFSSDYNMENFNFPYQEKIDFGRILFSYNNNLNLYLIAYLLVDNNGLPHIYEHKFRMTTNELFNKSLSSNVYSVEGDSEVMTTVYNEHLESGFSTAEDKSYFFKLVG